MDISEYLEQEVEKMVEEYKDVPEGNMVYIEQIDNKFDYEIMSHEKVEWSFNISLDEDFQSINDYIVAIIDLVGNDLDTPFPDDYDVPTLMWNPKYKIDNGKLIVYPEWELVFGLSDEIRIEKERNKAYIK